MVKIDVIDEGVIDSMPLDVYKAILDEYAGVTHWWMPLLELKQERKYQLVMKVQFAI